MRMRAQNDSGAVAVIVAIMLVVFVGLSALVIDVGYMLNVRRQLQAAADAAALAGCRELILENGNAAALAKAEEYALLNAVAPGDDLEMIKDPPLTEVGPDYVKVTVRKRTPVVFARIWGYADNVVHAQAKAKIAYVSGARTPVPWALPILRVTRATAQAGGGPEIQLTLGSNGRWTGSLPSGSSGEVTVRAYNSQTTVPGYPNGVPEVVSGPARIVQLPSSSLFADIRLGKGTYTSGLGEQVTLTVELKAPLEPGQRVEMKIGNNTQTLSAVSPTIYQRSVPAPDTDQSWETFDIEVAVMRGGNQTVERIDPAVAFWVRRSTFPMKAIQIGPTTIPSGSSLQPYVEVELNEYQYGVQYELKVIGGGGETGNYMAVDFSTIRHPPYWRHPQDPKEYPGLPSSTSTYYDYIAGTAPYEFVLHIGDALWTQPGNLSGPQTRDALITRFAGDNTTFAQWQAAGEPGSRRLIYVPVTEKLMTVSGQTGLRVITFAMFFCEDVSSSSGGALVRGRFVRYTLPPGTVSETPPDRMYIETPRLVSDGLDF